MPTRRFLPGTPCFLGSCAIYIHLNVPMTPLCYLAAMAGGAPPPHTSTPTQFTFLLLWYWLPRAKLRCFSAKSDRCTGRTRRSDAPRCCKLASIKLSLIHISEPTRLRRISYAVFCLKKKNGAQLKIVLVMQTPMAPLRYLATMAGGAPPCFDLGTREPNCAIF